MSRAPMVATRTPLSLRPTIFGLVTLAVVLVTAVWRPPVADPSVAGVVWAALAAALVLGLIWPVLTARTVRVRVLRAPTDLVVGQLGTVQLELTGRAAGLTIGCTGADAVVVDVGSPGRIVVPLTIGRRGAFEQLRIDVASDAPFGMASARTVRTVALPRPMLVGPAPDRAAPVPPDSAGQRDDRAAAAGSSTSGDAVRSVRPYVTGDPAHLVHWPSTARTGALVVRELEPPSQRALAVLVDLGATGELPDEQVEAAARRAAAVAQRALADGVRVWMGTAGPAGPVGDDVADELAVQRRLALALSGALPTAPEGWTVQLVSASDASAPGPHGSGAP